MKELFITLFLFICIYSFAQQTKTDSLLAVNNAYTKEDSTKVIYLTNLIRQYSRHNEMEKLKHYSPEAIAIAEKLPQTVSLTNLYEWLGRSYHGHALYLEAINYYNKAIALADKRNDKDKSAGIYINLSALYASLPDYPKALEANLAAIRLYNDLGDKEQIASSYMNLGLTYIEIRQPLKAIEYIRKALLIFDTEKNGINYGSALGYEGIANSYLAANDTELSSIGIKPAERNQRSLAYFNKALKIAQTDEGSSSLISPVNSEIGNVYEKMGDPVMALEYYQKSLEAANADGETELQANAIFALGNFYLSNKNFATARSYLHQSLDIARSSRLLVIQRDALQKLSMLNENTGRFDSALLYYKHYIAVVDTIFNDEGKKEVTRKQLQLDFAVKENDYKLLQEINESKLRQQQLQIGFDKKVRWFLVAGLFLLLIVSSAILYSRHKTRKLNLIISAQKQTLEQLGQVKDKIFSIVSHDMRAPVNSLMSFIDLLDNGNIPQEKLTLYAKELRQSLSYTSSLMNNLLNWAASQMQGFKPVMENFSAIGLVSEVIGTLQHHSKEKQVSMQNNVPEESIIHSDRNMTAAILRNLVSNAVKFSPKDSSVIISLDTTGNKSKFSITDQGSGMSKEALDQINGNIYMPQESKRGTANEKGTGLGLMLCKIFAAQMGASISAHNNEKGMTVELMIHH